MPIGEKEESEIANDELGIMEFLKEKKDSEEPGYSSEELIDKVKLSVFTVNEVENHLSNCSSSTSSSLRRVDYKGKRYYVHK